MATYHLRRFAHADSLKARGLPFHGLLANVPL